MRTRTLPIALLTMALLAGACGRFNDEPGPGGGGIDHPTGADQLVLRVATGGGFVTLEWNLRSIAGISIYGDGRMIVEGPMIEIYPGPALPNLQVSHLNEDAIQAILQRARTAGLLGQDATYDYPCVTDLPTTTFTVAADGKTHTVSAYALGFTEGAESSADCPGVDAEARAKLFDFQTKMGDLRSWLPEGSIGPEEQFEPSEMRIYVQPYRGDPELTQAQADWPLARSLGAFGDEDPNFADLRCGVIGGEDLKELLPQARSANELTPWTSEGGEFSLIFRPLLPDEHTC